MIKKMARESALRAKHLSVTLVTVSFCSLGILGIAGLQMQALADSVSPCERQLHPFESSLEDAGLFLSKTQGTWAGTARGVSATGEKLPEFEGRFRYSYDPVMNQYIQTNIYEKQGAEPVELNFTGKIENKVLFIDSDSYENYASCAWMMGSDSMMFYSRKKDFDGSDIVTWELISATSENSRVRSAQKIRNGRFDGMIYISETKRDQ